MSVLESKPLAKQPPQTKLCVHCGRVKPISKFYVNRDWEDQLGRDLWCMDCVGKCLTKDAMREYFWENHREWNEKAWASAKKKAEALAANNAVYQKSSGARKEKLLEQLTCNQMPTTFVSYYQYFDPAAQSGALSYGEAKKNGDIVEDDDPDIKKWSEEWFGEYSERELRWLNRYYDGLKHDKDGRELEFTHTLDDYAHNIAVAALTLRKLQADYRMGRCSIAEVKDAQTMYDNLNKSANFAECKRKEDAAADRLSVGEIALYLEQHGHPMTRKIEWEPDDVDRAIAELHHIVRAVGLDK